MLKHPELTLNRCRKYVDEFIKPLHYRAERVPLAMAAAEVLGEPIPYAQAVTLDYQPFAVGQRWGRPWCTTWFRARATIPTTWAGQRVVALVRLPSIEWEGFGVEGLAFVGGHPAIAINRNRAEVELANPAVGGETVEFFIEAACNRKGDAENRVLPEHPLMLTLEQAELAQSDAEAWALYHDAQAVRLAIEALAEKKEAATGFGNRQQIVVQNPRVGRLLFDLNAALNVFSASDRTTWTKARAMLAPALAAINGSTPYQISAIGHAHIDTAWLWPLRESIRKCARTFQSQLVYAKQYPEFVFGCSQAIQYSWMKHHYPTIYAEIREAIRRGQWEPLGGQWIEPDCNLPSGESLVRQLVHGQLFFQREFGVTCKTLWIPDVFGYAASLPQMMAQAGIEQFVTQKISWNQYNRFPHHTFLWEGIDGTAIFTHFPPADTYNATMVAPELQYCVQHFADHDRATRSLYVYGYGDGGGGPTPTMLELARRYADFEGLPTVKLETVESFFAKAKADARDLPRWVGELYLEMHRGTYTTQGRTKRANRRNENALHDAELLDALDWLFCGEQPGRPNLTPLAPPPAVYDCPEHPTPEARRGHAGALDRAWKLLLLNQFHDIIPGSSTTRVYLDAAHDHQVVQTLAEQVASDSLTSLAEAIGTGAASQPLLVVNSLAQSRIELLEGPGWGPRLVEVPALGYTVVDLASPGPITAPVTVTQTEGTITLETAFISVVFDENGLIESLFDLRAGREVIAAGQRGNLFQLHRDDTLRYDAWEIEAYYRETVENLTGLATMEVVEQTPLRTRLRLVRRFGQSTLTQTVTLHAHSARLDFDTTVDWQERHRLLKVAFPVDIRAEAATYEIQYGSVQRPTHSNTSWDMARFEVCAQRWVDLGEPGYGVALLNDGKQGHDVWGNTLRLSLLRGPTDPDPVADIGLHHFRYALLPHPGDWRQAHVVAEAAAFNCPLRTLPLAPRPSGALLPPTHSFAHTDSPNAVIEVLKVAEDGDGLVLRLYEAHGQRGPVRLHVGLPVGRVHRCDLLERPAETVPLDHGAIDLYLRPFEIVSLRLRR